MERARHMPGLRWTPGFQTGASVSFYAGDEPHAPHEHDEAHLSVLLTGDMEEITGRAVAEGQAGSLRLRPDGFRHAVRFGRRGALVLTLPPPGEGLGATPDAWLPLCSPRACREVLRNLALGVAADAPTASAELVALTQNLDKPAHDPAWLRRAHERIVDEPAGAEVATMADEAGVHRIHFARMFSARFGQPPSVLRRRAMLDHAMAAILGRRESLSEAALAAGFADQAHMTRAFTEFVGIAPARLRSLLR